MGELTEDVWPILRTDAGTLAVAGADHVERTPRGVSFHRLPTTALARIRTPFMRAVEAQPAGVRLRFETTASAIRLELATTAVTFHPGAAPDGYGAVDLFVDGADRATRSLPHGGVRWVEFGGAGGAYRPGDAVALEFDGLGDHRKSVELYLPYDVEVELISVNASAPITAAEPDEAPRWVHHGSSISHGMDSARPSGTWPMVAARRAGVQVTNLGFAGNAVLDPHVARAIRDRPADILSAKIGVNVLDFDGFRTRTFVSAVEGFLDTIREGHPETPLWVISPILSPAYEDRPGPVVLRERDGKWFSSTDGTPEEMVRGRLNAPVVRELLAEIVALRATEDPHLHYLDGLQLYGPDDAETRPLPDDSHPDSTTHEEMGRRFAELVLTAVSG